MLPWARWSHIEEQHPDLGLGPEGILDVVAAPDERVLGRRSAEEWFYRRDAGPSEWIKVVVHFRHDRGVIITAFARRLFP